MHLDRERYQQHYQRFLTGAAGVPPPNARGRNFPPMRRKYRYPEDDPRRCTEELVAADALESCHVAEGGAISSFPSPTARSR
jgi:hypothetical protein